MTQEIDFCFGDQGDSQQDQSRISNPNAKILFAIIIVHDIKNLKNLNLTINDVKKACNVIFNQVEDEIQLVGTQNYEPNISPLKVLIEPVLTSSLLKASALFEVSDELFDALRNHTKTILFKDDQQQISRRFHFKFQEEVKMRQLHKQMQTGRFQNEFVEIDRIKNKPTTEIIFAVHFRDNQMYTIKKMQLKPLPSWQNILYDNDPTIREVKALLRLHHKNVLRIFSWWIEEETINTSRTNFIYEQLEYVCYAGVHDLLGYISLFIQTNRKFQIQSIFMQLVEGLSYINRQGIFHRDLKPENILVTKDYNGSLIVKICDFDLCKSSLDKDGLPCGWIQNSRPTGTDGYGGVKSKQGAIYDGQEELYRLGMVLLDLCHLENVAEDRLRFHKNAAAGTILQTVKAEFPVEIDLAEKLIHRKYQNLEQFAKSKEFQDYSNIKFENNNQ